MAGKGNPHLNGFPMPTYSYFFPHMLGGMSPPALPGLSLRGYSSPSPASKYPSKLSLSPLPHNVYIVSHIASPLHSGLHDSLSLIASPLDLPL